MPLYLTKLANARLDWAATRPAAIAGHIAYSMDAAGTMYGRVALGIDSTGA